MAHSVILASYTQCHWRSWRFRSRPIPCSNRLLAMCRVILTALLAVGLFAVCVLTALWLQPDALSKLSATHSEAGVEESIALHPNAIARMRAQMARRVAPWQPQAAQFVQERVAMVMRASVLPFVCLSVCEVSECAMSECAHCGSATSSCVCVRVPLPEQLCFLSFQIALVAPLLNPFHPHSISTTMRPSPRSRSCSVFRAAKSAAK